MSALQLQRQAERRHQADRRHNLYRRYLRKRPPPQWLFADQNKQVKIVVADAHGSTLATRLFFVFWDGRPGNDPIEIRDGKLIYFDASDQYDSMRLISMPPTAIDWITARLPGWLR
ncbi:hypothetical protein [Burkholderia anthina]|uniref:hypothetical protein n=1 Tax=Burkholderia anthina TaxID=179879 RepID=UPI001FC8581F|nr:hypothetical protein [Burkholderia anthina]